MLLTNSYSELTFQVGSQESFFVSVETKGANQIGEYNLTVDSINVNNFNLENQSLTAIDSIQTIDTVTGSLTDTDLESSIEIVEEDSYLIKNVEVGQEIKVSFSSDVFDGKLDLLQIDSTGSIQSILDETNEVIGIGTTETATFIVEADANYLISVMGGTNSADAIKVGEYNLISELI
ncbi:hypothetical protein I4641_05295 [Waterburya agarophytonicola K14]|uniref:Uncharacterized protein n=1 Tax=Waterburya agarophytonicola KI4 TaxID=2874699 RepID=A0A964BPF7_9CYAN|nr:hypothetical protein [Waterburya agarophytonicola]MCC0176391.1 hypothetical protein [Waterburya agarophytonicola KI4]